MSDSAYDSFRLWTIVALCFLRLAVTRFHLQAYLNLAERWVEQMKREAGRISVLEIQRRVCMYVCGWVGSVSVEMDLADNTLPSQDLSHLHHPLAPCPRSGSVLPLPASVCVWLNLAVGLLFPDHADLLLRNGGQLTVPGSCHSHLPLHSAPQDAR